LLQKESDEFLLRYARRLLKNNSQVTIQIVDINKLAVSSEVIRKGIHELKQQFPDEVKVNKVSRLSASFLSKYSFMLISYQAWNLLSESENKELSNIPSTLIINKKVSRFHTGARNKIITNVNIDPVSDFL
jgi:hypothetical protein